MLLKDMTDFVDKTEVEVFSDVSATFLEVADTITRKYNLNFLLVQVMND